jgi:hypothetical protein
MIIHDDISFFTAPKVWLKDKYLTVLNQKKVYAIAFLPGIISIFGLIADLTAVFSVSSNTLLILLLCFLFVFGLFNMYFIFLIQRTAVRLQRQKDTAKIMHKVVAEGIREYLAFKNYKIESKKPIKLNEIKSHLTNLLKDFCTQYMMIFYRPEVTITLKYLKGGNLYPIRSGDNELKRSQNPEQIDKSFVYKAINKSGNKLSYVYVKNLDNIDKKEMKMLSGFEENINKRATGKYRTFIALPIRSGKLPNVSSSNFTTRPDLGILGFDLLEPYGFGNLEESEIHVLLSLADLISEPVKDLIDYKKKPKKWKQSVVVQN